MEPVSIMRGGAQRDLDTSHFISKQSRYSLNDIKLEDIPKEVLLKYGIILDDEESFEDDAEAVGSEEDEGKLVIDEENPCNMPIEYKVNLNAMKGSVRWYCSFKDCRMVFPDHYMKSAHETLHCPTCFILATNLSELTLHMEKHCSFRGCLDLIESELDLEKHRKIHQHETKPFQCPMCKRRFRYYHFSKKHLVYCKVAKRLFTCGVCKIAFRKMSQLEKHSARHTNSIQCVDCWRMCGSWKLYNKHLYKMHDKRLVYSCMGCPRTFLYHESLVSHLKCHNMDIASVDLGQYTTYQPVKRPLGTHKKTKEKNKPKPVVDNDKRSDPPEPKSS